MMAKYTWKTQRAVDRTILKDGETFGHIRLTPTGVAWRKPGVHGGKGKTPWQRIPIDKIAALAEEEHGKPANQ